VFHPPRSGQRVEAPTEVDKEPEGNRAGLDLVTGDAAITLLVRGAGLDDGDLKGGRRRLGKAAVEQQLVPQEADLSRGAVEGLRRLNLDRKKYWTASGKSPTSAPK
jgi:hypothetical protein